MNGRLAVYSVITGGYDTIKQPATVLDGVDLFMFTDRVLQGGAWRVITVDDPSLDSVLLSRKVKMLPHLYLPAGYEYSVYVDADMVIKGDFRNLVDSMILAGASMALYRNSKFISVHAELESLVKDGRVPKNVASGQWQRYTEWGFKDDMGHTENGLLVRRHGSKDVIDLMELWWSEFQRGCRRDQISLLPCIYRHNFKSLQIITDGTVWNNPYVTIMPHNRLC